MKVSTLTVLTEQSAQVTVIAKKMLLFYNGGKGPQGMERLILIRYDLQANLHGSIQELIQHQLTIQMYPQEG